MRSPVLGATWLGLGLALTLGVVNPEGSGPKAWADEAWNQYRGPRGDGTASQTGLPTTWSETEHVRWKVPIRGKGWSSPVVWGQQVWLTSATPDGKQLFAICVDFETGQLVHDIQVFEVAEPQYCIERNSYASPTPYIEEGRVYVHFGAHGTACLDTRSGSILWTRQDLACNHFRGPASSPVVWQDLLILTFDGFDFQYVVALDKQTGRTVWKSDRGIEYGSTDGDAKKAYATPAVVSIGGREELIDPSAGATVAYDPRTGRELWRVQSGGMNASCRPVIGNGLAFVGTADGGYNLFAVRLGGEGDVTSSRVAWKLTKGAPRYASPALVEGLLYMGSEQGVITCVEAETGQVVWQERLGGLFMPSPVYGDGKLYFFSEEGQGHVLAPGRQMKKLATNQLNGEFMASPAVAGKSLVLRTKEALYRIEE